MTRNQHAIFHFHLESKQNFVLLRHVYFFEIPQLNEIPRILIFSKSVYLPFLWFVFAKTNSENNNASFQKSRNQSQFFQLGNVMNLYMFFFFFNFVVVVVFYNKYSLSWVKLFLQMFWFPVIECKSRELDLNISASQKANTHGPDLFTFL